MLNLYKNRQNQVDVTVSNESELNNPKYLWVFTHLESKDKTYFIPLNISVPHAGRYDTFTFETNEGIPQVYYGNNVNIYLAQGQYTYVIYDQLSSTNLNPQYSNSIVENGLARVEQNEVCYTTYISENDDAEAVVYYDPTLECNYPWNTADVLWNEADFTWETQTPVLN